jgi:hypothetical protein
MNARRSTIGLALLCAFLFSLVAVQSASAVKGIHAFNTTAVTCVKGASQDFSNADCSKKVTPGEGPHGHSVIGNDVTTAIDVAKQTTPRWNGVLAGVATEITCNNVEGVEEKSSIHNVNEGGLHTVTGVLRARFTGCTVAKPSKCVVKEPIEMNANFQGVEELGPGKEAMGIEFIGAGSESALTELTFENKGAEKCSLLNGGKPFIVKGSAIATGETETQSEQHMGAVAVYEDANEMQTLEIGLKKASFTGALTLTMSGAGGNPISFTTVT